MQKKLLVPPYDKKLFLNISPQVMKHKDLYKQMNQYFSKEFFISPQNIIVDYAKGAYIQNPTQDITPVNKDVLKKITEIRNNLVKEERNKVQFTPIAELSTR